MWEFGVNVNDTKCSAFASWYEEALRAEEESQSQSCSQGSYGARASAISRAYPKFLPPLVKSEQILHIAFQESKQSSN